MFSPSYNLEDVEPGLETDLNVYYNFSTCPRRDTITVMRLACFHCFHKSCILISASKTGALTFVGYTNGIAERVKKLALFYVNSGCKNKINCCLLKIEFSVFLIIKLTGYNSKILLDH